MGEVYWRRECKPGWVAEQEDKYKQWDEAEKAKPKEEQEWYQKWLRRQENRPGVWANWKEPEDAEIYENEQREDPGDKEWQIKEEEDKKAHEAAERAKPKEEQEWYQKWLR